jgi:hypothetical protein
LLRSEPQPQLVFWTLVILPDLDRLLNREKRARFLATERPADAFESLAFGGVAFDTRHKITLQNRTLPREKGAASAGRIVRQFYLFIVLPGVVASPFFSAEPAVPAPWLLASLAEGMELPVVAPVALFFIFVPPPAVVPPSMDSPVVVLLAAGPPACEFPPAVLLLLCASASVLERASAAASAIDLAIMVVSSGYGPVGKILADDFVPALTSRSI